MKGERRRKGSSACAPAEAAIERQLSKYPAATGSRSAQESFGTVATE